MSAKCPHCFKPFDEVHVVHSNTKEPFLAVNVIEGLNAYGAIWVEKEILCRKGDYLHLRFTNDGEERLIHMVKFDPEYLAKQHEGHASNPLPCEHEGCTETGIPCYLNWIDEEPNGWYCPDHAHENGFCPGCGLFSAGIESFDFSQSGLCENCQDELESEMYEPDEYDEYDDEYDY